ncbi:MAG: hypothetical protein IT281_09780 [Ignavibacteria bacterium]|nr:hypothetical protein [Ignavibacteria bacterium]
MKATSHLMIFNLPLVIVQQAMYVHSNPDHVRVGKTALMVSLNGLAVEMVQHQVVYLLLVRVYLLVCILFVFVKHLDHTSSSAMGYYLFIDPTGRSIGDEAHFMSPSYLGGQPRCLHFWYHLYGTEHGQLQIQQKPEIGEAKILWSKSTYQGKIAIQSKTYSIIF